MIYARGTLFLTNKEFISKNNLSIGLIQAVTTCGITVFPKTLSSFMVTILPHWDVLCGNGELENHN